MNKACIKSLIDKFLLLTLSSFPMYVNANPATICKQSCDDVSLLILVLVCLLYFAVLLIARYLWIVLPNNRFLRGYAEEVKAQLIIEQDAPEKQSNVEKAIIPAIGKLLDEIEELVPRETKWYCWLLSGTGKQLAGWRHVHRAKVFAIDLYSNSDAQAEAIVVSQQLIALQTAEGKKLTTEIDKELENSTHDITKIKSLTKWGRELIFDSRDNNFEGLANWQNRATWLVMVSLLIIVILGITNGNANLFILGAVGGLLSRMRKVLIRKEHAFDYGASWSTLFLAPVVGAITGWVGVLLVLVLANAGVLGPVFDSLFNLENIKNVSWATMVMTKEAMALAVAFGFSATFFERVMENFEGTEKNGTTEAGKKGK